MEDKSKKDPGSSQNSKASLPAIRKETFQGVELQKAEQAAVRVAASARAEVESAFIMAMKMPRNRDQARTDMLQACKNSIFASMAKYKKPVGKKEVNGQWQQQYVEGPSIRFAEEAIRAWKNVKVQNMVIYEDNERRISFINVVDLENNISYSAQITVEKTVERKSARGRDVVYERLNSYDERVFIVVATDDEIRNKELALTSKEIRNAVLRIIPQDITQEAMIQADATMKAGVSVDPEAAKKQIIDAFVGIGVKPVELEKYMKHGMSTVSPAELADLRIVYNTIKNGEATWADYAEELVRPGGIEDENKNPGDVFLPGDANTHQGPEKGVQKGKK